MDNAQLVNLFTESTKNYSSNWGSSSLIREWLDDGQIDIILRTKCYTDTKTLVSVASQREYNIGTDVLQMIFVTFDGKEVQPTTLQEGQWYLDYPSDGTANPPEHYYVKQTTNPLIGFMPTPSTGSLNIVLHYLKRPPALTTTSNDPVIPDAYHRLIVKHAMYNVLVKDAKLETAQRWWEDYERGVEKMRQQIAGFDKRRDLRMVPYGTEHKQRNLKAFSGSSR